MNTLQPEYIINSEGIKTKVVLDYHNYLELMELIEDLQDSKLIAQTKNEPEISLAEFKRKKSLV